VSASALVLLALPWLLLAVNHDWFFTEIGIYDDWDYHALHRNYPEWARRAAQMDRERPDGVSEEYTLQLVYASERLGWVLPGYLAHRCLPALAAHIVLHLAFYYLAVGSVFFTILRTIGPRAALLTATLFGSYFYFLGSISWSYPDGAAATYVALSIALLTAAAASPRPWLGLFLAGATAAGAILSHTLALVVVAWLPGYFFLAARTFRTVRPARRLLGGGTCFLAGAVAATALLGAVNASLDGPFLFFTATIRKLTSPKAGAMTANLPWAAEAHWLVVPLFAVLCSAGRLACRAFPAVPRPPPFVAIFDLLTLSLGATYLTLHLSGKSVLDTAEYVTLLLPAAFLSLGAGLFAPAEEAGRGVFLACLALIVACAVVPVLPSLAGPGPWPAQRRLVGTVSLLSAGAVLAVLPWKPLVLRVLALGLLLVAYLSSFPDLPANMSLPAGRLASALLSDPAMRTNYYARFVRMTQAEAAIRKLGRGRWPTFVSQHDDFYEWSQLVRQYHQDQGSMRSDLARLRSDPGALVVCLTRDSDEFAACCRIATEVGLTLTAYDACWVSHDNVSYLMTFCEAAAEAGSD
jgi:hypothetical protein